MSEGSVRVDGVAVVVGGGGGDDSRQREEDRAAADTIDQLNQRHSHSHSEADSASASSGCAEDTEYTAFLQQRAQGDEVEVMHTRQPQSYSREDEMILPHQQTAQSHYRYMTPQEFTGIFPQYNSHMYHGEKSENEIVIKRDVEEPADDRYEDILELGDKVDVRRNLDVCSNASGRSSEGLEHGTPPGLDYAENKDGLLDLHLPHRDMRIQENSTNFVHLAAALHSPGAHSHTQDGEDTTDLYQSQESLHRLQPAYQQSEVIQHSNNYQS